MGTSRGYLVGTVATKTPFGLANGHRHRRVGRGALAIVPFGLDETAEFSEELSGNILLAIGCFVA